MQRLVIKDSQNIQALIQDYFHKNEDAQFIHRLHGILLFLKDEKSTCDSIGLLFGNSPRTISNWIKKINKDGNLEALRTKVRTGKPPRLNKTQLAEIKIVLQKQPEQSDVPSNLWDGKSLSFYIEKKYQIKLGVRRCQELFHELGFSLKRARTVVAKADELKKEAFKKNFKKN